MKSTPSAAVKTAEGFLFSIIQKKPVSYTAKHYMAPVLYANLQELSSD